jgi:lysophospholipase L1-like esterase
MRVKQTIVIFLMVSGFVAAQAVGIVPEGSASTISCELPGFKTFVDKARRGEPVVVAYLGGSITCGASTHPTSGTNAAGVAYDYSAYNAEQQSWRALTFQWLRARFEKTPGQFRQVHAAIGGTPSLLGSYRLGQDVLEQKPDLVFVEFAVNDNGMGRLTRDNPDATGSILRTSRSIVDQLRKQNPQVALFMPLSTHRVLEGSARTAWGEMLDVSHDQTRLAAEMLHVPYVSIKDAFYGGAVTGPYYDGPDVPGNYVHPAPYGYQVYAEAVKKTLTEIFKTGSFTFRNTVNMVAPYPVAPRLITPEELIGHASGWRVESPASCEAPVLKSRSCLVASSTSAVLEYPFSGTAVGLWVDVQSKGAMDMWLDGKIVGRYANNIPSPGPFTSRFFTLSSSLDPSQSHTLRLVPVSVPEAPEPLILLRGITIDTRP